MTFRSKPMNPPRRKMSKELRKQARKASRLAGFRIEPTAMELAAAMAEAAARPYSPEEQTQPDPEIGKRAEKENSIRCLTEQAMGIAIIVATAVVTFAAAAIIYTL